MLARIRGNTPRIVQKVVFPSAVAIEFLKKVGKVFDKNSDTLANSSQNFNPSDEEWAQKLMRKSLKTAIENEDKEAVAFQEKLDNYKNGLFPVLFITGLLTKPVDLQNQENNHIGGIKGVGLPDIRPHMAMAVGLAGLLDLKIEKKPLYSPNTIEAQHYTQATKVKDMPLHNDGFSMDHVTQHVGLYAINASEGVSTNFMSAQSIWDKLNDKNKGILSKKIFSWRDCNHETKRGAIISKNNTDDSVKIRYGEVRGLTLCNKVANKDDDFTNEDAGKAVDALKKAINSSNIESVELEDASCVFFNNESVIHSRGEYETEKSFQRLLLTLDLEGNTGPKQGTSKG